MVAQRSSDRICQRTLKSLLKLVGVQCSVAIYRMIYFITSCPTCRRFHRDKMIGCNTHQGARANMFQFQLPGIGSSFSPHNAGLDIVVSKSNLPIDNQKSGSDEIRDSGLTGNRTDPSGCNHPPLPISYSPLSRCSRLYELGRQRGGS